MSSLPTDADLPDYAARVVASKPDVIVSAATAPSLALKDATKTIPIVFYNVADPVAIGLVPSLAHPGGNITGLTNLSANFIGKQLGLLKDLLPSLQRFAAPYFPADPVSSLFIPQLQSGAAQLGIEPVLVEFVESQDYRPQLDRVFAMGAPAVLQLAYGEFTNAAAYDLLYNVYLTKRIPAQSASPLHLEYATPIYGLVHYAANAEEIQRRRVPAAVVAILKGAKPADIPVELPTIFDVVVNTWLAQKIGVTIPTLILAQATLIIDYDIRAPKAAN